MPFPAGHLGNAEFVVLPSRGMDGTGRTSGLERMAGAAMNMIDLILTVCLSMNPSNCREEHLYFESRGSLLQCMFLAPSEIAKWTQQHPTRKVMRWRCAFPSTERSI
jgi:hypothetical protein